MKGLSQYYIGKEEMQKYGEYSSPYFCVLFFTNHYLKKGLEILKDNKVMAMFPEGTRSKTGEMGEFKRGASLIASRADVPIVPVKIEGNYGLFSKMTLKIGEPLYPTNENKKTLTDELYLAIKNL